MIIYRLGLLALLLIVARLHRCNAGEVLTPQTTIAFASIEEGRDVVKNRDAFLTSLSPFDCKVRLRTNDAVTEEKLVDFLSAEVIDWEDDARGKVIASLARIRPKLESFSLPLPPIVTLIQTTGKEEGDAAYTRGASIFLPRGRLMKMTDDQTDRLLVHELFHVLSRNASQLRRDLYRIVGFEVCPPITLPPKLALIKLTNPDAPLIDCVILLKENDSTTPFAPVLYSSAEQYDDVKKPSLFKYLTFRMLKVEQDGDMWKPALTDGEPVLIDPAQSKSFAEQIGANTKYIIHPDEILADNFVLMITQAEKLSSPWIVERMKERLLSKDEVPAK